MIGLYTIPLLKLGIIFL